MTKILNSVVLLCYCLFIFWLSDRPALNAPMWFAHQDKMYHAGAYAIMAVLAWRVFRLVTPRPWLPVLVFCSLYGISDEWHQSFVESRYADVADWLADTSGAGLLLFLLNKFTQADKLG